MSNAIAILGLGTPQGRRIEAALSRRGHASMEIELPKTGAAAGAHPDTATEEALGQTMALVHCLPPFEASQAAAIRAATETRTPYVDTCTEQALIRRTVEEHHRDAMRAGIAVLPGHHAANGFAELGAHLLNERCGPVVGCRVYRLGEAAGATASAGTPAPGVRLEGGSMREVSTPPSRNQVRLPGLPGTVRVTEAPGGETVRLPLEIATLQEACGYDADCTIPSSWSASWAILVDVLGPGGAHMCRISGTNLDGDTAELTAEVTHRLAEGSGRSRGVGSAGRTFPAEDLLYSLRPAGIRWQLC